MNTLDQVYDSEEFRRLGHICPNIPILNPSLKMEGLLNPFTKNEVLILANSFFLISVFYYT